MSDQGRPMASGSGGIPRMDIEEFRMSGLLQEANRLFFHPRGLSLETVAGPDGVEFLGGIWDYRDSPAGVFFPRGAIDPAGADYAEQLRRDHLQPRCRVLGSEIEIA